MQIKNTYIYDIHEDIDHSIFEQNMHGYRLQPKEPE